jgi:hypothetical protein
MAERLELALVRQLGVAHALGGHIAEVAHAAPYQWANACHDLWESGHLDVLEYAVCRLQPIYPQLSYLTTLSRFLQAMPRSSPPALPFSDDPSAEIQIVRRPDCDKLLLCFCAMNGTVGLPLNFIHQWLGRCQVSVVYIKDFRNLFGGCGFPTLGPTRTCAVEALRCIAAEIGAKQIHTIGVSLGGFAALHYGLELGAISALNLGGASNLMPAFVESLGHIEPQYYHLCQLAPEYTIDIRERYRSASSPPRVLMAYSSRIPCDRRQAEHMAGLANITLIAVDDAQHNVVAPLVQQRRFMGLLDLLCAS